MKPTKKKNDFRKSAPSSDRRPQAFSRSNAPRPTPERTGSPKAEGAGATRSRDPEIPKAWRIVPGFHAIREVLAVRPKGVRALWLREGFEHSQELKALQSEVFRLKAKIEIKPVSSLDRLCATHQGAILMVEGKPEFSFAKLENKATSILVYLDGIEDPHNLGAILRTSWLVGADGLFIPEDRAVGLTPTAHKVACGGAEHVPIEEIVNFTNRADQLKKMGYWMFGLSHKAKQTIFDIKIPEKVIWAIGSEDRGLRGSTERLCDELVSIPQVSAAASYNASVATGMALAESLRTHSTQHKKAQKSQ